MRLRLTNAADWKRLVAYVKELPFMRDGKGVAYLVSIEEMKSRRTLEQTPDSGRFILKLARLAPTSWAALGTHPRYGIVTARLGSSAWRLARSVLVCRKVRPSSRWASFAIT